MPIKERLPDPLSGIITTADMSESLKLYGIGPDIVVMPLIGQDSHIYAINRRSQTTKKAFIKHEENFYVLKQLPWYCASEEFANYSTELQHCFSEHGLPVPDPLKSLDDRRWVKTNGNILTLRNYVHGIEYRRSEEMANQAGLELGRLNHTTSVIDLSRYRHLFKEDVFALSRQMIVLLNEFVRRNIRNLTPEDIESLKAFSDTSERSITNLSDAASTHGYGSLVIPVHGDYNSKNLVFSENCEVAAVLDFDNSSFDDVSHDIAEGLLNLSYVRYSEDSTKFDLPDRLDVSIGKSFLDGYDTSNRHALEESKSRMPSVAAAVLIELLTLGIIRGDYKFSDVKKLTAMPEYVESAVKEMLR